MTLSDEFKGEAKFAEEQSRKAFDEKNDVLANHMAGGASAFRHDAREIEKLESTNVELTKRVAELEHETMILRGSIASRDEISGRQNKIFDELMSERNSLLDQVKDLQAQFAWTPVEKGLPTEPGWYVFTDVDCGAPELLNLNPRHWRDTKGWNDNFKGVNPDAPDWGYTHYRRIELPEAK